MIEKSAMRKSMIFGILIILIGSSLVSSIPNNKKGDIENLRLDRGQTLYVGGHGPNNYTRIQDAINNANYEDTVFVYNGTYYERITMKAGVTVQGEGANVTTIDANNIGNGVVTFYIIADAKIDGFTICNAGSGYRAGIYCRESNPTISNNIIIDNGYGITCCYFSTPIIDNNIISNNTGKGIYCTQSSSPTIIRNIIKNSYWGIYLDISSATIVNNTITNNTVRGITCAASPSPIIMGNTISRNGGGILCANSSAIIHNNIITENDCGVYCEPGGWEVIDCESLFPNITNNKITDNDVGIKCYYSSPRITDNDIIDNNRGIEFDFSSSGYYCDGDALIYHNNFINNTEYQAYDDSIGNQWNNGYPSGGNYWDDYNGTDANGDGIGDTPYNITGGNHQDMYPLMHRFVLGDMNVDGVVNFGDINPFVLALSNPAVYQITYHILPILHGDCNQDGSLNFGDINPFVKILIEG